MQWEVTVRIPVVKTKKALGKLQGAGQVEVLVDNETAMKNVMKMAKSSGASAESERSAIGNTK